MCAFRGGKKKKKTEGMSGSSIPGRSTAFNYMLLNRTKAENQAEAKKNRSEKLFLRKRKELDETEFFLIHRKRDSFIQCGVHSK